MVNSEKLRLECHCAISCTTLYRYLNDHEEKGRVPAHSEDLQVGRPSRFDDIIVDRLRTKVIENCGIALHSTKKFVMEVLGREKESSKGETTARDT